MICGPHGMMNDTGECPYCRIGELQARLESEEAHYTRLYEQYRALECEAIEIVDYADFPRPMTRDMDRIQKKSVDALRALIKREVK